MNNLLEPGPVTVPNTTWLRAVSSRRKTSRLTVALMVLAGLVVTASASPQSATDPTPKRTPERASPGAADRASDRLPPPNPFLSFLPTDARPNEQYWRRVLRQRATDRALRRASENASTPGSEGSVTTVLESEPNDTPEMAQVLSTLGTGPAEDTAIDVDGTFAPAVPATAIGPFAEDDGSIPLASATGLLSGISVRASGEIGDGPFGSAGTGSGDFDFFRLPGVAMGQHMLIDIETPDPFGDLDTFVALYDSVGTILALNEDEDSAITHDAFLAIPAPGDDDFTVSIAGSVFPFASLLSDPFDSSSGTGVGSEGTYAVTISLEHGDPDWYAFDLEACDILGIDLGGSGEQLQIRDPDGDLMVASSQDLSGVFPDASPLPGGGRVSAALVAERAGRYTVRAIGAAGEPYSLAFRLFRHPDEQALGPKTLFVDFDGATIDPVIFGGTPGPTTLSPLASFLANWGLAPGDEDAVIEATLASLHETLVADLAVQGPNAQFAIALRNSRDHDDTFGRRRVSRLIIGGSIAELGLPTIGIAQSIDPGNFETSETGVVLLDLLSRPAGSADSLNSFPRAPDVSIIDLVGSALGTIAAHEAGHLLGNFHTEQGNPLASVMDRGGNLPNTLGLGLDGIFGTADDIDVDFVADRFEASERFSGIEDTLTVAACGCTAAIPLFADGFEAGDTESWSATKP